MGRIIVKNTYAVLVPVIGIKHGFVNGYIM